MHKFFIFVTVLIFSVLNTTAQNNTIYNFEVKDIYGDVFNLSSLKGQKIMIVNTASKCGLTPQYKELQELYSTYKGEGFTIIGFPANNFMKQEPGTNDEIAEFCEKNYGVDFLMMSKVSVKGKDIDPLFDFLTDKSKNGVSDEKVSWNFQKFLINEKGELELVLSPRTSPKDKAVVDWIERK